MRIGVGGNIDTEPRQLSEQQRKTLSDLAALALSQLRLRQANVSLAWTSDQDWLTGLDNRRGLNTKLEGALAKAAALGRRSALLLVDMDGFKRINDVGGHDVETRSSGPSRNGCESAPRPGLRPSRRAWAGTSSRPQSGDHEPRRRGVAGFRAGGGTADVRTGSRYEGGYTVVKDHVRIARASGRETFVPLAHPPGHAQVDFGEAVATIGGVRRTIHFFCMHLISAQAAPIVW